MLSVATDLPFPCIDLICVLANHTTCEQCGVKVFDGFGGVSGEILIRGLAGDRAKAPALVLNGEESSGGVNFADALVSSKNNFPPTTKTPCPVLIHLKNSSPASGRSSPNTSPTMLASMIAHILQAHNDLEARSDLFHKELAVALRSACDVSLLVDPQGVNADIEFVTLEE